MVALDVNSKHRHPNLYNPHMDNETNDEEVVTSEDLLGDKVVSLYGHCPNCHEMHTDLEQVVEYLNWLSRQYMINFN